MHCLLQVSPYRLPGRSPDRPGSSLSTCTTVSERERAEGKLDDDAASLQGEDVVPVPTGEALECVRACVRVRACLDLSSIYYECRGF